MTFYLNLVLALLAIPLLILPFGKLRDKRVNAYWGFTKGGVAFYICMFLATGASIWKEYLNSREEDTKEKRNIDVQSRVDTITQKIRILDDLNQQINEVNDNTSESLVERERLLGEFNKMSEKIKAFNEYEKIKFNSEGAELVPANLPNFTLFDSIKTQYFLNFPIKNIGNRTASNVDITIVSFTGKNGVIISDTILSSASTPETRISPISKSNGWPKYRYIVVIRNYEMIENFDMQLYLYVSVNYIDAITKESKQFADYYMWNRFIENGYKFGICPSYENNLVKEYMSKHNLKL